MGIRNEILSPYTLYKWDSTIFDPFVVPKGLDRESVLDSMLLETIETSTIYTSPHSFKMAVAVWTNRNFGVWQKLYDTTQYEYNPIWNYDRTEESTDKEKVDDDGTLKSNATNDFTRNLGETEVENRTGKTTSASTADEKSSYSTDHGEKVAAFNTGPVDSSSFDENGSSASDRSSNGTVDSVDDMTVDRAQTGTTKNVESRNDETTRDISRNSEHNMRAYGNIGVTTTQQMIEQEREVVKFNLVDYIVDSFKQNFCVMCYS